jgi:hypothetical protein
LLYVLRGYANEETRKAMTYGNLSSATEQYEFEKIEKPPKSASKEDYEKWLNENMGKAGAFAVVGQTRMTALYSFAREFFAREENKKFLKLEEAIGADYDRNGGRLNTFMIETYNKPMLRVEDYVPMYRSEQSGEENEHRVVEDLLGAEAAGKIWVSKGMTEKRINISPYNQMPIELGLYKTWTSSVKSTEHLVAYGPLVQTLNSVFKNKGNGTAAIRQVMSDCWGDASVKRLDGYIAEFANPEAARQRSALDDVVHDLRGKTATAYLAWKMSSILKQAVTSPWPYFGEINQIYYLKACFEIAGGLGSKNKLIREKSVYMNNRLADPMYQLVREQLEKNRSGVKHAIDQFNAKGMAGLEWIDWICVAPGWLAKYRQELVNVANEQEAKRQELLEKYHGSEWSDVLPDEASKENRAAAEIMTPEQQDYEAVARADDLVRRVQPGDRSVDQAALFKGNNEIGRAFLQFQNALNRIWQHIRYDMPLAVRERRIGDAVRIVSGYALAGICLGLLLDDDDDDEKEERNTALWVLYNSMTQFTDAVPVIGEEVNALAETLITGKRSYRGQQNLLPVVKKGVAGVTNAVGMLREDDPEKQRKKFAKAAGNFADAVGIFIGTPVSGAKELGWALGYGDGDGEFAFKPEAILGRRNK